ncbi:hypothetical protein [Photobacterium angustum]|uniref:hypothetical protein n=1 Tax=Photobacterium angustum TaxID=661 RepID=UPI000B0E827C|nr:hypothetical protein [Photobacterium angustum]
MFKKLLLTLAFILPFASQATTTDTTKLIKKCETKYKADKQKKNGLYYQGEEVCEERNR